MNKVRDDRTKTTLAATKAKSQSFVKIARDNRDAAETRVAPHRPKVDLNDVAQLTRTAQTLEMIVKPMRDKGLNWSESVAAADWETLHALARFAEQTVKNRRPERCGSDPPKPRARDRPTCGRDPPGRKGTRAVP